MRSIRICLTISPRYIPLVIFSYLFGGEGRRPMRAERWFLRTQVWVWKAHGHLKFPGQSGLGRPFLRLSNKCNTERR